MTSITTYDLTVEKQKALFRLQCFGFSLIGASTAKVDTSNVNFEGLQVQYDHTIVQYKDEMEAYNSDFVASMGVELLEYIEQHLNTPIYVYFVYIQGKQVTKYELVIDREIHIPIKIVYNSTQKRFYSLCCCGQLEWIHPETKMDANTNDDDILYIVETK